MDGETLDPRLRRRHWPLLAALAIAGLLVLGALPGAGSPAATAFGAGSPAQVDAPRTASSDPVPAVHWSTPAPSGSAAPFSTLNGSTNCVPLPPGLLLGDYGLNFSVTSLPANGSGTAPLNFSWNVQVSGGGLPPYQVLVNIDNGTTGFNSSRAVGSTILTSPGVWYIGVWVEDSSCSQLADVFFPVHVWGALGPNAVVVTASTTSASLPATITYSVNTSALPVGWAVTWNQGGIYPYEPVENYTYFLPGVYNATACFVEPDGSVYDCANSPNVTVTGPSPVSTSVTVANGSYPVNVTFQLTVVNASVLPASTELYLYAWNGLWGNWTYSNSSNISLTERVGCGHPWLQVIPFTGNCTFRADYSLLNPGWPNGTDDGYYGFGVIWVNLTANGSPSNWYPTASYSFGPTNGSAPLNITLNVSVTNGLAPYQWSYAIFGNLTGSPNGSRLVAWSSGSYWNGSLLSFAWRLNVTGYYWASMFVFDSADSWVDFSLPLINVGNVTIPAPPKPLSVQATQSTPASSTPGSAEVIFETNVVGGRGPYTVQWSFGDGSYASSMLGVNVSHTYSAAGTYQPWVTVSDGLNQSVMQELRPVTVPAPVGTHGSPPPTGGPASGLSGLEWLGVLALAGAFICLSVVVVRREVRREGEALVAGLPVAEPTAPPYPPN